MQTSPREDPNTLFSPCPACGKPRPIDGETRVRCAACGEEHPVPPDIARAARVYRDARANVPLQLQQTGHIEELISHANVNVQRFRIAAGLLAAPLLGLFVFGLHEATLWASDATRPRALFAPTCIAPLLVLIGSGAFVWARLARSRAAVESLLWARPMADMPGELACRMCGAPLGAGATSRGTVKCRYCHRDNMVGPEISRRAAGLALVDYATHSRSVFDRLGSGRSGRWPVLLAIAAPLVVLAVLFAITRSVAARLASERRPFEPSIAYVKVQCPIDDFARLRKASAPGYMQACVEDDKPVLAPFDAGSLRGATILSCSVGWQAEVGLTGSAPELKVIELYSDGLTRNHVAVDAGFGVRGECLVEGISLRMPPLRPRAL
jgi:hypothetical protein